VRNLRRVLGQAFVENILHPPAGTEVTGFKEIRYFDIEEDINPLLDFMTGAFEGCKFVLNIRPADQVARSSWWAKRPLLETVALIERYNDLARQIAAKRDNAILVNYADYNGNAEAFAPLFTFLQMPFDLEKVSEVVGTRLTHARQQTRAGDAPGNEVVGPPGLEPGTRPL
jgi:hypothetical protein